MDLNVIGNDVVVLIAINLDIDDFMNFSYTNKGINKILTKFNKDYLDSLHLHGIIKYLRYLSRMVVQGDKIQINDKLKELCIYITGLNSFEKANLYNNLQSFNKIFINYLIVDYLSNKEYCDYLLLTLNENIPKLTFFIDNKNISEYKFNKVVNKVLHLFIKNEKNIELLLNDSRYNGNSIGLIINNCIKKNRNILEKYIELNYHKFNNDSLKACFKYLCVFENIKLLNLIYDKISKQISIFSNVNNNNTLFGLALNHDNVSTVKFIIDKLGVFPDKDNNHAIKYACEHNRKNMVKMLLEYDSVDPTKPKDNYCLTISYKIGNFEMAEMLMKNKKVINGLDYEWKKKMFNFAYGKQNINLMKFILDNFHFTTIDKNKYWFKLSKIINEQKNH